MKVVVVVPTLNERENIAVLAPAVFAALTGKAREIHLLVVDDHSPDGTADVVRTLAMQMPNLHLMAGPGLGLGAAYVRGINHALTEYAPDVVIQMDADLSHIPADLPRLVDALDKGADLAIGSRYIGGNRTPRDWGWHRRALSWGGNLIARHWLGLGTVHDCTAGFRAWRTAALKRARFADVDAQGYVFLVALLRNAVHGGAKVCEVPVYFPDRTSGTSKLGIREILDFARWTLRNRQTSGERRQCAAETR